MLSPRARIRRAVEVEILAEEARLVAIGVDDVVVEVGDVEVEIVMNVDGAEIDWNSEAIEVGRVNEVDTAEMDVTGVGMAAMADDVATGASSSSQLGKATMSH